MAVNGKQRAAGPVTPGADAVRGARQRRRWALGGVVVALLLSGLSPVPVPVAFDHQDKLYHVLGFAVLVLSGRLAFPRMRRVPLAAACVALAILIELVQGLMSGRSASGADMLANLLGMALGFLCAGWAIRARGVAAVSRES